MSPDTRRSTTTLSCLACGDTWTASIVMDPRTREWWVDDRSADSDCPSCGGCGEVSVSLRAYGQGG